MQLWRAYDYADLVARDKCNLDVTWLAEEGEGDDAANADPSAIALLIIPDDWKALGMLADRFPDHCGLREASLVQCFRLPFRPVNEHRL